MNRNESRHGRRLAAGLAAIAGTAILFALMTGALSAADPSKPGDAPPPAPAAPAAPPPKKPDKPAREGEVRIARASYEGGKTTVCFAEGFLANVAQQTRIKVDRQFTTVDLASEDLFSYPMVIFSGEGAFKLSVAEKANLKTYLSRGGFMLASAGCSNAAFASSIESLVKELFPGESPAKLPMKHPVFHTLYDIDALIAKKPATDAALYGLEIAGRLILLYSPLGLNDTANAGSGCCCCGGNELRNAHLVNANILAYVLTR